MLPDGDLPQCHAAPDCCHRTKKGCFPMEIFPSLMQRLTVAIEPTLPDNLKSGFRASSLHPVDRKSGFRASGLHPVDRKSGFRTSGLHPVDRKSGFTTSGLHPVKKNVLDDGRNLHPEISEKSETISEKDNELSSLRQANFRKGFRGKRLNFLIIIIQSASFSLDFPVTSMMWTSKDSSTTCNQREQSGESGWAMIGEIMAQMVTTMQPMLIKAITVAVCASTKQIVTGIMKETAKETNVLKKEVNELKLVIHSSAML